MEKSELRFRRSDVDLVSEVSLQEWTKDGNVELPITGSGIVKGVAPSSIALTPSKFVTALETLEPSTSLTLKDIFRPFTVVVAGPTKLLQMTARGELVESSGKLRPQTNPWAWLYVSSVGGLVFFSALLFLQNRTRRGLTRKR